jgi:hypothetical protein
MSERASCAARDGIALPLGGGVFDINTIPSPTLPLKGREKSGGLPLNGTEKSGGLPLKGWSMLDKPSPSRGGLGGDGLWAASGLMAAVTG